ncbi:hypothetical protein FOA52_011135 [Chlamydomonas sp. UWO 241]|nr:hypothetical protein FOA52_011135 [Chlamydomonas sp. UWO 241]
MGASTSQRPIYRPSTAYSCPPASVVRNHNGVSEGQLMYQIGKFAPLGTTYAPYWLRQPPQRPAVSDLRLAPSQRTSSCYAPEFLQVCTSPIRPTTTEAVVYSPSSSRTAASRIYARPVAPHASTLPASGRVVPMTSYTRYINSVAVSSFHTGGRFVSTRASVGDLTTAPNQSSMKAASAVLSLAQQASRIKAQASGGPAHSHGASEAAQRASVVLSHDRGPNLTYKARMAKWGIVPGRPGSTRSGQAMA